MSYKISVITPVYNVETYIKDAVASVIKQSLGFDSIQLLLCDDCSTDSSYSLIKQYAERYNNVTVLQTSTNTGSAGIPRNLCLEHVDAPYVMFLDGDDLLCADACETLYNLIHNSDYDLVAGNYLELHYGKKTRPSSHYDSVTEGDYLIPEDTLAFRKLVDPFWTKIYKTDIIKANNLCFDSIPNGEDTVFMLKYLVCCKKCRYVNAPVYTYRIREDSLSRKMGSKHFVSVIECDRIIRNVLTAAGFDKLWQHFITDHVSDYMDILANSELPEEEMKKIITMWYPEIQEASRTGLAPKTPYAQIIFDDMKTDDPESAIRHMLALARICSSKNRFLQDLMQSRSWQLISKLNRVLKR